MKYYSRLGIYKASNVDFNPASWYGTSYSWYQITKRINNTLVLNTYGYSSSTIKHVYKLRRLLGELGLQFVEIEAPRGLQDLTAALNHTIREYADLDTKRYYAKDVSKYDSQLVKVRSQLAIIEKFLNVKTSSKVFTQAFKDAKERRINLLKYKREQKQIKLDRSIV